MTTGLIISVLIIVAFVAYMYFTYKNIKNTPETAAHSSIRELTDQNFQAQVKTGVTLVDFWASWCMPCKMMAPILNETAEELDGSARIAKLDVEENRASSAKYGVRSIPTMILFKNGREIDRFVGVKSKEFLVEKIKKAL